MKRTWIRPKVHLLWRKGYEDVGGEGGGGSEILCVYSGALKNRYGQGEG